MSAIPESVAPASPAEIAVTESQVPSAPLPGATILGYPRIGRDRELKRAVESFWKGDLNADDLRHAAQELRGATRSRLTALGLTQPASVPADFTLYDQVLQVTATLGAAPARFRDLLNADGALDLEGYFTLARGEGARPALEMTKWLDSNYRGLPPPGPSRRRPARLRPPPHGPARGRCHLGPARRARPGLRLLERRASACP